MDTYRSGTPGQSCQQLSARHHGLGYMASVCRCPVTDDCGSV